MHACQSAPYPHPPRPPSPGAPFSGCHFGHPATPPHPARPGLSAPPLGVYTLTQEGAPRQVGAGLRMKRSLAWLPSPSWVLWGPPQHLSLSPPTSSGHLVWLMLRVRRLLPIHLTRSIHSSFPQLRAVGGMGWGKAPFPPPPHALALPLPHGSRTTAPQPPNQCTWYLVPAIPFLVCHAGPFLDAPPARRGPLRRVGASSDWFAPRLHDPAL